MTAATATALAERAAILRGLGWTERQAEWLALVCLHSGVFTRRQYADCYGVCRQRADQVTLALIEAGIALLPQARTLLGLSVLREEPPPENRTDSQRTGPELNSGGALVPLRSARDPRSHAMCIAEASRAKSLTDASCRSLQIVPRPGQGERDTGGCRRLARVRSFGNPLKSRLRAKKRYLRFSDPVGSPWAKLSYQPAVVLCFLSPQCFFSMHGKRHVDQCLPRHFQ